MHDHDDDEWGPTGFLKYLFFPLWALWPILKAFGTLLSNLARRLIGLFRTSEDEQLSKNEDSPTNLSYILGP